MDLCHSLQVRTQAGVASKLIAVEADEDPATNCLQQMAGGGIRCVMEPHADLYRGLIVGDDWVNDDMGNWRLG